VLYEDYVEEKETIYDPETGEQVALAKETEDAWEEAIKRGRDVAEMQASEGWKIVEEWLSDNEKFFASKLVHEVDIDKIRRFQEAAKCFGSVKSFVSSVIKQSMFLAERRDNQTPKGII